MLDSLGENENKLGVVQACLPILVTLVCLLSPNGSCGGNVHGPDNGLWIACLSGHTLR